MVEIIQKLVVYVLCNQKLKQLKLKYLGLSLLLKLIMATPYLFHLQVWIIQLLLVYHKVHYIGPKLTKFLDFKIILIFLQILLIFQKSISIIMEFFIFTTSISIVFLEYSISEFPILELLTLHTLHRYFNSLSFYLKTCIAFQLIINSVSLKYTTPKLYTLELLIFYYSSTLKLFTLKPFILYPFTSEPIFKNPLLAYFSI